MAQVEVEVECPVYESFRVQQVAGMFDLPLSEKAKESFCAELPSEDEPWSIGLIVGPSGSGKSTLARAAYGDRLYDPPAWASDQAVIDGFGETPVRTVVRWFTAVGFGSPRSWIKPFHVLSNGERFRCDLARALSSPTEGCYASRDQPNAPLIVFDEFTSVVDRTVAKIGSAAVAKAVRSGPLRRRFVAVSCHDDIAEWLEPDWVFDTATGHLTRRRLRRPEIRLEVHRCELAAWALFARHHYLSGSLAPQARCYQASWEGAPVAFAAVLPVIGRRSRRRFSRIVTLPDYQGVGIGMRTVTAVSELLRSECFRVSVTSSHPGLIGYCDRSPDWRATAVKKVGQAARRGAAFAAYRNSAGRAVVSFEFMGGIPVAA